MKYTVWKKVENQCDNNRVNSFEIRRLKVNKDKGPHLTGDKSLGLKIIDLNNNGLFS